MKVKGPKIELWPSLGNGKWYFHKRSANGRIVGDSSQGYKQKRYAMVAIRREHPDLPIIELFGKV